MLTSLLTVTSFAAPAYDASYYYYTNKDETILMRIGKNLVKAEIIYTAQPDEMVSRPQYDNGKLYFYSDGRKKRSTFSRKVMCLDLVNGGPARVLVDQISSFNLIQGRLYCWRGNPNDPFLKDLWVCNADGSGLTRTAAVGLGETGPNVCEVNGKLYFTSGGSSGTVTFHQMNLDGSGFSTAFRQSHYTCDLYYIQFSHNGFIYYVADSIQEVSNTGAGVYRTTPGGAATRVANIGEEPVAAMGESLYFSTYTNQALRLMKADLSGQNRVVLDQNNALKNIVFTDLEALDNGNLLVNAGFEPIVFSTATLKAVKLPDLAGKDAGVGGSAASAKTIEEVELQTEPETLAYKVGDKFKAGEISLRVTYKDGTTKDLSHDKLSFTANGTKVNADYKFKEAGKKSVVVSWGDYTYKYTITVK